MKKMFFIVFILPILVRAQNIYTVSNIAGVTANFYNLQRAIDSIPDGSILYVFPSSNDYGNIILHKQVTIYGTGFMLDQNGQPFTTPNISGVILTSIFFAPGSDNSYVEGLQVTGLTLNGNNYFRFLLDSVNNVTISKCYADIWVAYPSGNTIIQTLTSVNCSFNQCYLYLNNLDNTNHSGGSFYAELGAGSQNLQFNNNIIDSRLYPTPLYMSAADNNYGDIVFTNNTIICGLPGSNFGNCTYINNFFVNTNPAGTISSTLQMNGAAFNNITNAPNLFAPNSGNYQNANADSIFTYSTFGYHSWDQKYQVVDTSFAKKYATEGNEVGAFGGNNPFILSGIPNLPSIYAISIKPDSSIHGNILVHIKAKASY